MNYISTRNKNVKLTSAEAIKKGLSDDGGLFVPDEFPKIKKADIESLLGKTYIERANFILSKFLTDFTKSEIEKCTEGAYGDGKFASFGCSPCDMRGDVAVLCSQ